jgi:hypothetical protein
MLFSFHLNLISLIVITYIFTFCFHSFYVSGIDSGYMFYPLFIPIVLLTFFVEAVNLSEQIHFLRFCLYIATIDPVRV